MQNCKNAMIKQACSQRGLVASFGKLYKKSQCGQGQVKHYQAAKHEVQPLGCQSWCHGHDVRVLLLGQLHMGFAVIEVALDVHPSMWMSSMANCKKKTIISWNGL